MCVRAFVRCARGCVFFFLGEGERVEGLPAVRDTFQFFGRGRGF